MDSEFSPQLAHVGLQGLPFDASFARTYEVSIQFRALIRYNRAHHSAVT